MKKIAGIILLAAIIPQGLSMELSAAKQENRKTDPIVNKEENTKTGDRGLILLESLEGPTLSFEKYYGNDEQDQEEQESNHTHNSRRFRGHWSGIEFGFNNYLTSENSLVMPVDIDYMSLHSGKSRNFNINISQLSIGLSRHIGFVTGLGFNWNNYRFDGNNNILKGTNGIIEVLDPETELEKSKLATIYLTLPFMLEMQIPVNHNHINIAAGAIGALKLGSHTKIVYEDDRESLKSSGDFSLNMLRYGTTARAGYGNFQIYGTYYLAPLFKTGKGPGGYSLFPFEIGVAFTIND
jgi:hypothetical protein